MKVKEEKKANTMIVRFETSTSPSWKDIKIFIKLFFDLYGSCEKDFFSKSIINSEELKHQIQSYR